MLKVNNKKTVRNISDKSFKASKDRNIVAIIAIALTTVLFTSIFTMGIGTVECIQRATMRQAGGDGHAILKYITDDQFNAVKDHKSIKEIAYDMMLCDDVSNDCFLKRRTEFWYYDKVGLKLGFIELKDGTIPVKENEVIADTMTLKLMGVEPTIGSKVTLQLNIRGKTVVRDFVLSGYWESDPAFNVGQIFASKAYVDAHRDELQNTFYTDNSYTGAISAYIMFNNSFNLEKKLNNLLTDCGFSSDEGDNYIDSNVNWSYVSTNFGDNSGTIAALGLGLLLIMLTGYLIIYNIFQISVIQDIRFYGLLKTIGTTGKQIKKIIFRQALLLCAPGIPIGLITGFFIGKLLVPLLMSNTSYANSSVSVSANPLIFIGAALFSLFTVFISTRKPCKTAGKISPIEAVRYSDNDNSSRKMIKNSSRFSMGSFAVSNLGRNKKRTIITVISLSLCIVLLNTVFILANSIDMDKFLNRFFDTDFLVAHADYFNFEFSGKENEVSEKLIDSIEKLNGFEKGGRLYGGRDNMFYAGQTKNKNEINTKTYGDGVCALYGLEDFPLERLNLIDGEADREKLMSGKYILEGVQTDDNDNPMTETMHYKVGDKVILNNYSDILTDDDESLKAESHEFTVLGHVKVNTSTNSDGIYWGSTFYLPYSVYKETVDEPAVMSYVFNVKDGYEEATDSFLKNYTENIEPLMNYQSKQTVLNSFSGMKSTVMSIGVMLCAVIGLIGILNFINAMITSIISRRKEFAVLQSIGMTRKQLKHMLCVEGCLYACFSSACSLAIGVLSALLIVKPLCSMLWFMSFRLIVTPLIISIPILFALGLIIPTVIYGATDKYSIVERLHTAE